MLEKFINSVNVHLFKDGKKKWASQVVFFSAMVAPVILISIFSYVRMHRELTSSTLSRRESIAYLAAATLRHQFDRLTDIGISLATRVRFRQLVSEGKWEEAVQILTAVPKDFP